mgnify:CR=1 FL=1
MRTSLALLILVALLSPIKVLSQQISADYFQNNIEVYFF